MDVFDRYAPFIQDYIYRSGWKALRGVQIAAGQAIFNSEDNVLLTASTASGKTEAAFFPMLTLLDEVPSQSVGILYIAPLKALINDQFGRISELCKDQGIPVYRWHGDAQASQKRKLLEHPSGILQITPESLESLMINKYMMIPALFGDLRFIVIDEIHSMLRGLRGMQTFCLIERLCRQAGCDPRRIGLSATIGAPALAAQMLASGSRRKTVIPRFDGGKEIWRLCMEHFYITGAVQREERKGMHALGTQATDMHTPGNSAMGTSAPALQSLGAVDPAIAYIYQHSQGKKCLIFTNSREECEAVCQQLRQCCELQGQPDRFLIHHGNLSSSVRESAEEDMKDDDSLQSICATATLELGVDIGKLERAFQIDAPATVSGFLQRMGRTGRRGDPAEMWFVMREDMADARASMPDSIPWYLIQGIALVQLYLEERFVEPPRTGQLPYSLLYHQTMSTLASCGEMTPAELASRVLTLSCFSRISQEDYRQLLLHLIEIDHINKTENGGLILGLTGERIVNNYKFYAVFAESVEYTVNSGSEELGTIVRPPAVGEKLAIAGRVWTVDQIDYKKKAVNCTLSKGNVAAYFGMVAGDLHTHILERMYKVLEEDAMYPYLMKNAKARLKEARSLFDQVGMKDHPLVSLGGNMWALFPWLGTYAFLALERFLRIRCGKKLGLSGLSPRRPYYMTFSMTAGADDFYRIVRQEAQQPFEPTDLLYPKEVPVFEKYDEYVPEELIRKGFAYGVLDTEGMKKRVLSWGK